MAVVADRRATARHGAAAGTRERSDRQAKRGGEAKPEKTVTFNAGQVSWCSRAS